jgi:hypothetical protein
MYKTEAFVPIIYTVVCFCLLLEIILACHTTLQLVTYCQLHPEVELTI